LLIHNALAGSAEIVVLEQDHPPLELRLLSDFLFKAKPGIERIDVQTRIGIENEIGEDYAVVPFSKKHLAKFGRHT
jgi:hypothetical protein